MTQTKNLVIHFIDGTKVSFNFPKQINDPTILIAKMNSALSQPYISIEAEGGLHLYPRENIKSIQIYPTPSKVPEYVITGAESATLL